MNTLTKRFFAAILAAAIILSAVCGCSSGGSSSSAPLTVNETLPIDKRAADFVAQMSLTQKACQMVQAQNDAIAIDAIADMPVGSVLSGGGDFSNSDWPVDKWQRLTGGYQESILSGDTPIPILYGIDAVHGVGKMQGAVVYPHNIGIGAANDPELTYAMGQAVANEMKLSGILLDFAPCVGLGEDPRWGRIYECYSSDTAIVTTLGEAFAKGLLSEGVMPCGKHFLGDGSTEYGSAYTNNGTPLDRGDTITDMATIREKHLPPYKALIDAGVKVIMPSHSSVNGIRMHEHKELLTDILKGELGFDGFVLSDWESVNDVSGKDLSEKVINAVNAGVDMLMQPYNYTQVANIIINAVREEKISQERIDDAVTRIIRVKMEMGLFEDPFYENNPSSVTELGSEQYKQLAQQLVAKSLVLLKNENDVLPLKSGMKVFAAGQALDDIGVQCGGWTGSWCGDTDLNTGGVIPGVSILDGLRECSEEIGFELITDKARIGEADVVIIGLGESPYAEWLGDADNISVTGDYALSDNSSLIRMAKDSGKPTVALIVAGRQVLISNYIDAWDAAVMCYLPGTEGGSVAPLLCGESDFSGKLPMPWYDNAKSIGADNPELLFESGYGLSYAEGIENAESVEDITEE